jgi:hypothetical protein
MIVGAGMLGLAVGVDIGYNGHVYVSCVVSLEEAPDRILYQSDVSLSAMSGLERSCLLPFFADRWSTAQYVGLMEAGLAFQSACSPK